MRKGIQMALLGALVSLSTPMVALADTHAVSNQGDSSMKTVSTRTHSVLAVARSGAQYHTVRAGETLWSIAHHYGVAVTSLERMNHMTSHSTLRVGKHLLVSYGLSHTPSTSKLAGRGETVVGESGNAMFGLQVVQYASQFLGVPYAYGGRSTSGFDCSGLVQFCFGHFGVYLGRDSYSQAQEGQSISRSNLQPGDLVFFDTYGPGASHVGIYAGGGRFINAAGSCVRYDSLDDGYWSGHFLFGRRVGK